MKTLSFKKILWRENTKPKFWYVSHVTLAVSVHALFHQETLFYCENSVNSTTKERRNLIHCGFITHQKEAVFHPSWALKCQPSNNKDGAQTNNICESFTGASKRSLNLTIFMPKYAKFKQLKVRFLSKCRTNFEGKVLIKKKYDLCLAFLFILIFSNCV